MSRPRRPTDRRPDRGRPGGRMRWRSLVSPTAPIRTPAELAATAAETATAGGPRRPRIFRQDRQRYPSNRLLGIAQPGDPCPDPSLSAPGQSTTLLVRSRPFYAGSAQPAGGPAGKHRATLRCSDCIPSCSSSCGAGRYRRDEFMANRSGPVMALAWPAARCTARPLRVRYKQSAPQAKPGSCGNLVDAVFQ